MSNLLTTTETEASALAQTLLARAAKGVGGEIRVGWPGGPTWLNSNESFSYSLGGTGAQAAWALTSVGASALLALQDRSAHMLAQVPGTVLLANNGQAVPASTVAPTGERRPDNYIIEFTKGQVIAEVVPPRSSRIITRFYDFGIEHDSDFESASKALASSAGAALLSGFNCVTRDELAQEIAYVYGMSRDWLASGLSTVHLELAGYDASELRDQVVQCCRGAVTSLGMSYSEYVQMVGHEHDISNNMRRLAELYGLRRFCVHADEWAVALTLDDAECELEALMTGCLLASCRAAAGHPVKPLQLPQDATFIDAPAFELNDLGPWKLISCSSPFLTQPASALGLGDTFTAGCLMVLGQDRSTSTASTRPSPVSTGADLTTNNPNRRIV